MWGSGSCLLHWQSSFDAIGFSAEKMNKSQNNIILTLGNVAAGENSEDTTGFTCVPWLCPKTCKGNASCLWALSPLGSPSEESCGELQGVTMPRTWWSSALFSSCEITVLSLRHNLKSSACQRLEVTITSDVTCYVTHMVIESPVLRLWAIFCSLPGRKQWSTFLLSSFRQVISRSAILHSEPPCNSLCYLKSALPMWIINHIEAMSQKNHPIFLALLRLPGSFFRACVGSNIR